MKRSTTAAPRTPECGPLARLKIESSYRQFVREKITAGLADVGAGRVHSHDSIRRKFLRISVH